MKKIFKGLVLSSLMVAMVTVSAACGNAKAPIAQESSATNSIVSKDETKPAETTATSTTDGAKAGELSAYQLQAPKKGDILATLKTSMGDMKIVLFPSEAPKTVENFTTHAKKGYYNGLKFHRILKDFMIQGGDPLGTGVGGESIWGTPFVDEFSMKLFNLRGALCMANSGADTNGSQFFIVQAKTVKKSMLDQLSAGGWPKEAVEAYDKIGGTPWLDQKHTVFGQIVEGLDVLDSIAGVKTDKDGKAEKDVIINSIEISTME